MRGLPVALAVTLGLVLPVSAAAGPRLADERPLASSNVDPLATLPVPNPIGARFRDGFMYVTTTEGLSVYDVTKPELPVPVGTLPLPHFENEDVDLGRNTLLVSNDPSEGVGVLYVIDISNPRLPVLRSAMPNGFIETGVPGIFGLPEPQEPGIGHTASCIQRCRFAYLAGTARGIQIVDLRDRDNPRKAGKFVPAITGFATHDVQVDRRGLAWIAGAEGTAAYDVSNPLKPRMVMRTDRSIKNSGQLGFPGPDPVFGIGGEGETPIDLIHHNSLRYQKRVVGITEEDYSRPTCKGAGSFQTWRITRQRTTSGANKLVLLDMFTTELDNLVQGKGWAPITGLCSAHYFDQRNGLVAIGWYEEGTRFLDVRDPAGIRQVGYWVPTKGETWSVLFPPTDPSGEIVYALDFARGIDVLRFDRSDRRARRAPVRRSWLRPAAGSPGTGAGRTGLTRKTDFGFVCRLPTARNAAAPKPELPGLPGLPQLP
jgi:hypothetical protein